MTSNTQIQQVRARRPQSHRNAVTNIRLYVWTVDGAAWTVEVEDIHAGRTIARRAGATQAQVEQAGHAIAQAQGGMVTEIWVG